MSRRLLLFLFACTACLLILAGCGSGSDGKNGANGTDGTNGTNGTDAVAKVSNTESCGVCHNDIAGTHTNSMDDPWVATGTSVTFNNGGTTTVKFNVKSDGAAYTDGFASASSVVLFVAHKTSGGWVNYTGGHYGYTLSGANISGGANGDYTLTVPSGTLPDASIAANAAEPHRFVLIVQGTKDIDMNGDGVIDNTGISYVYDISHEFFDAAVDVYPSNGVEQADDTSIATVSSNGCFNCHYDKGNAIFGKSHGVYTNAKLCVMCHNESSVPNDYVLKNFIHGIHNSEAIGGYAGMDFGYPQPISNCSTCHTESSQLTAVTDDTEFTAANCQTCHGGVENAFSWDNFTFKSTSAKSIHSGMTAASDCQLCHSSAAGYVGPSFATIHNGKDTATNLATKIAYEIVSASVTKDASTNVYTLTAKWRAYDPTATDPSTAAANYDLTNTTDTAKPIFLHAAGTTAPTTQGVRLLVGYYAKGTNDVVAYDDIKTVAAVNAVTAYGTDKVATTTVTLTASKMNTLANQSVKGVFGIIGVPLVSGTAARVTSQTLDFSIDGSAITQRKQIVDDDKCSTCHANILIHTDTHGHTTVGNVDACIICHNPSGPNTHYAGQAKSFKGYAHVIHSGQHATTYGGSGVVEYPNALYNCEACHVSGTYETPNQVTSLGGEIGTVDENSATGEPDEDAAVVSGPAAIACLSCHQGMNVAETNTDFNAVTSLYDELNALESASTPDAAAIAAKQAELDTATATYNAIADGMVADLDAHSKVGGYRVPVSTMDFAGVINEIMTLLGL